MAVSVRDPAGGLALTIRRSRPLEPKERGIGGGWVALVLCCLAPGLLCKLLAPSPEIEAPAELVSAPEWAKPPVEALPAQEFAAAAAVKSISWQGPFPEDLVKAAFRALDRDGSGLVSAREFRADARAHSYPQSLAVQSLALGDGDGDGKLSLQEFFQTLADPANDEADVAFWEKWFSVRSHAWL